MSTPGTSYRSSMAAGSDRFPHLVRAEFTKFRTVRGWVVGLIVGAGLVFAVGVLSASGSQRSCVGPHGHLCVAQAPTLAAGGEAVNDQFYFVHQQLVGDGSLTARLTTFDQQIPALTDNGAGSGGGGWKAGVVPWAKAGLIVKENTIQGSSYAAVMATGAHGVRMQYQYTQDVAGSAETVPKAAPRWLRLTRSGDTVTGFESADGHSWTQVGSTRLTGLPSSVQVGLFVASPEYDVTTSQQIIGSSTSGGPSQATATFDSLSTQGQLPAGSWQGTQVGDPGGVATGFTQSAGSFTVSGSGDIAPLAGDGGDNNTISGSLIGAFVALISMVVLGAVFVTSEYRRGLIRTTLVASPRRVRVLAAKAVVLASVVFTCGLVVSAVTMWFVDNLRRNNGTYIASASSLTEIRVTVGTAALLAVTSVFALAVGAILRRSASAVAVAIALVVLPYILAVSSVGALQWLLRVTPAAGFAVQQTLHQYPQVDGVYVASAGYFPLSPWQGFAVLLAWTAVALGLAALLLRTRDV